MNLNNLGYNNVKVTVESLNHLSNFELGRITAEHKERYLVATEKGEVDAEITGNMRFSANGREDFPAIGDWVALLPPRLKRNEKLRLKTLNNYSSQISVSLTGWNISAYKYLGRCPCTTARLHRVVLK